MPEWTLYQWLMVTLTATLTIIALLALLRPRHREDFSSRQATEFRLYPREEFPAIHATNGVPTLQQLMEGIEADPKSLGVAERLYEAGIAQFNHYFNNRDGVIETSRGQMTNLANCLSQSELALAKTIGISMAADGNDDQGQAFQAQYDALAPQAQIYAQHKRQEIDALRRMARDLARIHRRTPMDGVRAAEGGG